MRVLEKAFLVQSLDAKITNCKVTFLFLFFLAKALLCVSCYLFIRAFEEYEEHNRFLVSKCVIKSHYKSTFRIRGFTSDFGKKLFGNGIFGRMRLIQAVFGKARFE